MNKNKIVLNHYQKIDLLHIANPMYRKCVDELCEWLIKNDTVQRDTTTKLLFQNTQSEITARIFTKQDITVAGVEEVAYLLETFTDIKVKVISQDSSHINSNTTILELTGNAAEVLAYERTLLNILQRLSGIATGTQNIVNQVNELKLQHTPLIASTRKTQWSLIDKKAVALGGGATHRLNLVDGVLVKDNHLLILKGIYNLENEPELATKTFEIISSKTKNTLIEIEVEEEESVEALIKVASSNATTNTLSIFLDNFSVDDAKRITESLQKKYDLSKIVFEAGGGINSTNILDWAKTGVDVISLGALTHSPRAVDLSLEII